MAIKINFDTVHNPEVPTLILAKRNGDKIGQLNAKAIEVSDYMNEASEITFNIYKYIDNKIDPLWNQIVDFKLVYCVEWDTWFEITVELDESIETVKTVYCTRLGYAELSQIMLYNIEINTENDIARDEYEIPTVLYNPMHPEASLMHRIMEKAPHYSVIYVDDTIKNIQRTYTFNDISIRDAFQEIANEIHCLFVLNSNSDEEGKIQRTISIYDLESNCNDCGYRGEFTGTCPECGSNNINEGYGKDTTIFVTADELADDIQLTTDTASIKNCFKLEAGDDLMTATIRNCNPNGTDYIWYISDDIKADMTSELVDKIKSYDVLYNYYQKDYISNIDANILARYNTLVKKYQLYDSSIEEITTPIKGYPALMNAYYNTIDFAWYLKVSLMPNASMSETNAINEASKLTAANLSPVAVTNISYISKATADNSVLAMAKVVVDSRYQVKIEDSNFVTSSSNKIWVGRFIVTNYSDEEDTATSNVISIVIDDDYSSYVQQKIQKALNKDNTEDLSITGLFDKPYNDFVSELRKYSLDCLNSFYNSCQTCIDILIEQGIADKPTWSGKDPNLYDDLYMPYYQKLSAIESEIKIRQDEYNLITGVYDINGDLTTYGLQNYIEDIKSDIQNELDFQNYLGIDLWLEFCTFRREDKYSNDNYISDGLNNAELFKNANEFIEIAKKEIYKSAELQHSISASLKNLLVIKKFVPLIKDFEVGNWLRIMVDDKLYKLRLVTYKVNYDALDKISVEFSDVVRVNSTIKSVQEVIEQASSMATSYSSIKRQAKQGEESKDILQNWSVNGLNATTTKIISSAENQTQTWDSHGMLFREYDSISNTYSDEQLKIINSTISITTDNWETTKTAIGKFYYNDPITKQLKSGYGINGEVIVGKLLIGEGLGIYNSSGSLTFDANGFQVSNGVNTVTINPNNYSILNIKKGDGNIFAFNEYGDLTIVGDITAKSLTLLGDVNIDADKIGVADVAISGDYNDLKNKPNLATVATTGDYNDLINKPAFGDAINSKLDKPTNEDTATVGQYLSKEESGTSWKSTSSSITSDGVVPVNGKAVYDYAWSKQQDISNANKLLYIDTNGNTTFIDIDGLKTLLGI